MSPELVIAVVFISAAIISGVCAGLHLLGVTPAITTALWTVALWAGRMHAAAVYHRHRWEHEKCHARPTRTHLLVVAVRRVPSLRLRPAVALPAAPEAATTTVPDRPFTARTAI